MYAVCACVQPAFHYVRQDFWQKQTVSVNACVSFFPGVLLSCKSPVFEHRAASMTPTLCDSEVIPRAPIIQCESI